jgi:predicted phosphodiesterase
MDAKIEILQALQSMAAELGRAPKREEFTAAHYKRDHIAKHWGSWTILLQAAGLYDVGKAIKIDPKKLFYEDIQSQISQHEPVKIESAKTKHRILVIGDCHFPFVHKSTLEKIYEFVKKEQPTFIVQVGDLLDLYAQSKFPRSQNLYGPEEEEKLGVEMAREMWARLNELCPGATKYQLLGNHDIRPIKRVLESAPSLEHIIKAHYKNLIRFDGVTTIDDYRQELVIDNIIFHHGYRSQLGQHRDYTLTNFVCGHSHKGGVVFKRLRDEIIWELNAGFIGDADSKALAYTAQKIHDQTLGWGFIDEYGPRFIHA